MFNFLIASVLIVTALALASAGNVTWAVIDGSMGMLNLWCAVYGKR